MEGAPVFPAPGEKLVPPDLPGEMVTLDLLGPLEPLVLSARWVTVG